MSEHGTQDSDRARAIELASKAFLYALKDRWSQAGRTVQQLGDEHPEQGVAIALMAWADTFFDHATDGADMRVQFRRSPGFINARTGTLSESGVVPARLRWAGEVITARVAMDEQRFRRVVAELPDDPAECGSFVLAVLETCVQTINGLPRGYLLMGQDNEGGEVDA